MTKIKNTKKGMAKKTLSMSLVVAMLATSNVPVWAAEFSDGSEAAVATEAPAAEAFDDDADAAPVVEDTTEAESASIVNAGDVTTELSINGKKTASVTWGGDIVVTGKIAINNNTSVSDVKYRWVDTKTNTVATDSSNAELKGDISDIAAVNISKTTD